MTTGKTMAKTVLCYGIILGLYCLVQGVHSHDDDKHPDARHNRYGSVIAKDKIFIKSESPLRGRKIHQSAWSEEVTGNSREESSHDSTDSWNFEKVYSYLRSLIYKTEEMEKAQMSPRETVKMIRNKIKSEIKAQKKDNERLKSDFETNYMDTREGSEESDDEYESCEEVEDSSSEINDNRNENSNMKENDLDVDDCYGEESDEQSSETGRSNDKTTIQKDEITSNSKYKSVIERNQSMHESRNNPLIGQKIIILNGTNSEVEQNPRNTQQKNTRIGSNPKIMHTSSTSKNAEVNERPVTFTIDASTLPTSGSNQESTVKPLPVSSNEKKVDQFVPTNPEIQDKVFFSEATKSKGQETKNEFKFNGNSATLQKESTNTDNNVMQKGLDTNSKSATEVLTKNDFEVIITSPEFIPINNREVANAGISSNKKSEVIPKEEVLHIPVEFSHVYGVQSEVQKVDVLNMDKTEASLNKITEVNSNMNKMPVEFSHVYGEQSEVQKVNVLNMDKTEASLNKISEVNPNMYEIPVQVNQVYGEQSEVQKVNGFNMDKTEMSSLRNIQNEEAKDTQSVMLLDKNSVSDSMVFTKENTENNHFQQESILNYNRTDNILEEYILKKEFTELSENKQNELMNILREYNKNIQESSDGSQHSTSQNVEFIEESANQETFDTILEFLYHHSNNPLILSLRSSNKTLF